MIVNYRLTAGRLSIGSLILGLFILYFSSYHFYSTPVVKQLYFQLAFVVFAVLWITSFFKDILIKDNSVVVILIWNYLYVIYVILSYLNSAQTEIPTQILISYLKTPVFLVLFIFLFMKRSTTSVTGKFNVIFMLVALFAVISNFYDFISPSFSSVLGRAAGYYVDPNISGGVISFMMVAGFLAVPRGFRILFILICGLGVLITFSRGAWLVWGIGVLCLGWITHRGSNKRKLLSLLGLFAAGLFAMTLLFSGAIGRIADGSPLSRYLTPDTSARLGIGGSQFADHSANERWDVSFAALDAGLESPLFGNGLAFTREQFGWTFDVSTHNMYLLFWAEGGITGLSIYISFLYIIFYYSSNVGRIFILQMTVYSLFSHTLLEWPLTAILAAYFATNGDRNWSQCRANLISNRNLAQK